MELVIFKPTEDQFIQEISFNADEIKAELAVRLRKYEGLVYSEENIKEAKADRATLNKFKDAIENKRKEMKKLCLAPYETFETQIKEITAMIDQPILAIDTQVKNFESLKKEEKLDGIKIFFNDRVGDLKKIVTFEKVYNPKWLNATYKGSDIEKEIMDLFIKIESDLQVINELQSEFELQIKDTYLKSFDLTAALQEKKRLEEQAAKIAEHKRLQAEKQREAEHEREQALPFEARQQEPHLQTVSRSEPVKAELPVLQFDFRIWATREQLAVLKQFLLENDIKYGKVGVA